MKYILTCNENSKEYLMDELSHYKIEGSLTWFNDVEALFETPLDIASLKEIIEKTPLIFIRHFINVDGVLRVDQAESLIEKLSLKSDVFSIQLRSPLELRKTFNQLRNAWVDSLIANGNALNVKNPKTIISVYATGNEIYYGVTQTKALLSKWSAGAIHFSKAYETISRAENKLREVFDTFPIKPHGDVAVDLGAAPGGWTKVLNDLGFEVYAIDPANLDERLLNNDRIHHYQITSQQFVDDNPYFECDIIVNDMKMSASLSIEVFKQAAQQLAKDGYGIITIKLPKLYLFKDCVEALNHIRKHFTILYARQLFHNRNEFTVIVQRS